uniref:Uncharacterized protein n=1 Tax=Romanomermis culicivorax TaxID=13658 RepID=A0A915IRY7_ROMCU
MSYGSQILKLEPNGALCRGNTQCQSRCCYIPRSSVIGDGICINAPLGLYELCGEQSDLPQSHPQSQSFMANTNRYQNQKTEQGNNNGNFYSNAINQQRSSAPLAPERSYSAWNNVPPPQPLAPQVYPGFFCSSYVQKRDEEIIVPSSKF